MSVLLDANEELAKLYHSLRGPREVRSYCRETIILTQKLVLPLRCASYLVYLSHADLRSSRYDDCQIKLNGLADILCLTKHNLQVERENKPPSNIKLDKEIDTITHDMQEMILDLPIPSNYKKQFRPSSPTLLIQPFHLPSFINHDSCDCFYCICCEYQELVLHKVRLDALINVKQGNTTIATDFFHGALDLYKRFSSKIDSYTENLAKLTSYDLIPDLEKEFLEVYASVLLDYSYHVKRTQGTTEALNITNGIIDIVSLRKLEYPYLYNEVLVQKLGYIMCIPDIASKLFNVQSDNKMLGAQAEMETFCPSQLDCLSVTPESKQSKVTFFTECTPAFTPHKRKVKKCLPFDLSPCQDNTEILEQSPETKKFSKTPAPKIKIYTNNDDMPNAKTPAPKIKIYTNGDDALKAKTPLLKIQMPAHTERAKRTNKKKNLANIAFIAPEATSTPAVKCPITAESGLKSRTKLLTDRLRQSTKTSEAPAALVNDEKVVQNGKTKISVRKNLLSELTNSETEQNVEHGGAIRKSTRNRK